MINIRISAKTAYDHQMITRTLTDIITTIWWSLLEDSQNSRWSSDDYQKINRLSVHGHLMIIIRRSAKTAYDKQMITRTSTDYQHNPICWSLEESLKTADYHQMITRILTDFQHITIWWSLLEDLHKQHMIIRLLPEH